ncbi:MAG: hypothetical protein Q9166_002702 [cf. Caloplaca sp. 2 TL-2023]
MQWHHAREEFLAQELLVKSPSIKGALAKTKDARRAWCIWTRTFGTTQDDNVLNILRLVVEGGSDFSQQVSVSTIDEGRDSSEHALVEATAAILQAARVEASTWGMSGVQLWNPSSVSILAARHVDPSAKIVERDDESLTSLRWHGKPLPDGMEIDWIANEKYGWC